MENINQDILKRILDKNSLPSLSPVAVRLMSMAADDNTSVKDMASIIEADPGLVARLLRMVNSVAYGQTNKVATVSRALTLVGLREIRIMALSISLRDTLPTQPQKDFNYAQFWRGSLHRALLARETARTLGQGGAEEAFAVSLLLEIGLPVMLRVLTVEEAAGFPGFDATLAQLLQWEREHLRLDHRQAGQAIMAQWGLPEIFISGEQIPDESDADNVPPLIKIIDFARQIAELLFLPGIHFLRMHELAQATFALDHEKTNYIISSALSQAGETAEALQIEVNQESDLLSVMEKANEALSRLSSQIEPHVRKTVNLGRQVKNTDAESEVLIRGTLDAVMHEIRNPLVSVGGFARRLAQQAKGGDNVQQYAEVIMHEAKRLDEVLVSIKNILTPFTPKLADMDLGALLEEVKTEQAEGDKTFLEANPDAVLPEIKWHMTIKALPMQADSQAIKMMIMKLIAYGRYLLTQGKKQEESLQFHLQIKEDHVSLRIFGLGALPLTGRNFLASRSFGPELMLADARRVVEGHRGTLEATPLEQDQGFMLITNLPLRP